MKYLIFIKDNYLKWQTVFIVCSLSLVFFLSGCASGKNATDSQDPYEGYNRKVFAFNRGVDKVVYRPIAKVYDTITPAFVQKGVTNFFSNLAQVPTMGNDLLQGNFEWLVSDTGRLIVNTTLGIGGLFDVATPLGIEKHKQDFGLTLAKWGIKDSPYLIVPFLPPSTARDVLGMGGDYLMTVYTYVKPEWVSYSAYGLDFISLRASLLGADKIIDESFDPYVFMRDAYLQRRQSQIQQVLHPDARNDVEEDFDEGDAAEVEETGDTAAPKQSI